MGEIGERASEERESGALAQRVAELALSKKAGEVVILDVRGVVGYTDFFVICTGNTERQTRAIHDEIHQRLKHSGRVLPTRTEGLPEARWILLDYLDVVVHVFTPGAREFYRLEQLWGEVPAQRVTG